MDEQAETETSDEGSNSMPYRVRATSIKFQSGGQPLENAQRAWLCSVVLHYPRNGMVLLDPWFPVHRLKNAAGSESRIWTSSLVHVSSAECVLSEPGIWRVLRVHAKLYIRTHGGSPDASRCGHLVRSDA